MTPNITITAKGKDLIIVVKDAASTKGTPSTSGKSLLVASTRGNVDVSAHGVPGGKLGLNLYRPIEGAA